VLYQSFEIISNGDSGTGSLREAIGNILPNVQATIDLTPLAGQTIVLTSPIVISVDANISIEMAHMIQKLKRIEAENERLHKENEELLAQFARWAYNAYNKGITKEILDVSLPQVERTKK